MTDRYEVPQAALEALGEMGYEPPCGEMPEHIERWYRLLMADGAFWDYHDVVGGVPLEVHRRTLRPAAMVCDEWASLLMDESTRASCDEQACTDWLAATLGPIGFWPRGQALVSRAFALGTGAWVLWLDRARGRVQVRRHDARSIIPLSWDDDGVSECAFCSQARWGGRTLDQLQAHVLGEDGYHVVTRLWDRDGREVLPDGVEPDLATGAEVPWFSLVRPAIANTRADGSPYGMSVYADAEDLLRSVDLCYDALCNEVDAGKMRIFVSDVLVDYSDDGDGGRRALPFGRDNTVFRKVASADDMVQSFAPQLRTEAQARALRLALKALGQRVGLGMSYLDVDESGGLRTATEVSADNSALMRNVRKHENVLARSIAGICHAALQCGREFLGAQLPDEGEVRVDFDDSIIEDTASEKARDMAEVGVTMNAWEYRMKWYGEDEETAKANVPRAAAEAYEPAFER